MAEAVPIFINRRVFNKGRGRMWKRGREGVRVRERASEASPSLFSPSLSKKA